MYADAVFFESPDLENAFRAWLKTDVCKEEQGGFFICEPTTKSARNPAGRTAKGLGIKSALVIHAVAPVLNLSRSPRSSFSVEDWGRFGKLGWSMGRLAGFRWGWPVWFHTHPAGSSADPSPNDWSAATKFAQKPIDLWLFAVVACEPFSMQVHKPTTAACDSELVEWERLPFLSFRESVFRTASKQAGLYAPRSRRP